jgi:hypothetical protein
MTLSTELSRFLADHATAESWAAFTCGIEAEPTAANLAAAMSAKGYQVGEAEVVAALELGKQMALADHQLGGVVGGSVGSELQSFAAGAVGQYNSDLESLKASIAANPSTSEAAQDQLKANNQQLQQYFDTMSSVLKALNSTLETTAKKVGR